MLFNEKKVLLPKTRFIGNNGDYKNATYIHI